MSSIGWQAAAVASRMLPVAEREAVLGDLIEAGESSGAALLGVLGLVARRQAEAWMDWRPWLALAGLTFPLGMLLTLVSRRTAEFSAIYLWLYVNNWTPAFIENPSFRHDLVSIVATLILECLTLACWSWTAGFALGFLSSGAIPVNGILFSLVAALVEVLGAPKYLAIVPLFSRGRDFGPNAAVFSLTFYRVLFPLLIQAALVLLPSVSGMRHGVRLAALPVSPRAIVPTAAIATLAAIGLQTWIFGLRTLGLPRPPLLDAWPNQLLKAVIFGWPIVYCAASALSRRKSIHLKENHA
jgi:hypothetical protein